MRSRSSLVFLSSTFLVAAVAAPLALVACSSTASTTASGAGTTGSGGAGGTGGSSSSTSSSSTSGTGGSGTTTSSSTSTSTSSSSSSGAVTLTCASYCSEVLANCTGAQQQYGSTATDDGMANCLGFCASFPPGTIADTSGDTLGCHLYHGGAAKADPVTHCPHAGPTGGDKSPTGTAGICGEPCDAFCNAALAVCTGANSQFTDKPTCMTACQAFAADPAAYDSTDTTLQSANDLGCRVYHLTAASASATAAATHCPHIVTASPVCKN